MTVQDAPLTAGALAITNSVEGVTEAHLTFGFTDANPAGAAGDYTASITWGDSTTSTGTVAAAPGGGFTVEASHGYADEGSYPVTVTVADAGGSTTSATGQAVVADAPLTAGTLTIGSGVAGVTATPLTFGFTDANPGATAADFTATIDWGDATSSTGAVTAAGGGFTVDASHTYAHAGTFTVTVTVADVGGSTASATGQATVAPSPLTAGTAHGHERGRRPHAGAADVRLHRRESSRHAADFTATIDWGDTTSSAGTVTGRGRRRLHRRGDPHVRRRRRLHRRRHRHEHRRRHDDRHGAHDRRRRSADGRER